MAACWSELRSFYLTYGVKLNKIHRFCNRVTNKRFLSLTCMKCSKLEIEKIDGKSSREIKKKDTCDPLPKVHSPNFVETGWYEWWVKEGFFLPKTGCQETQEKFVLCLPPPNVTGTLHLGHALTCAVQDALVRWHRMKGKETLWIPGCDHAGIATQVVAEKQLWRDQRKSRHDLGREKFLEVVWDWKNRHGDTIYKQLERLGASLDWSKEAFTMNEKMSKAVIEAFVRLHEEGLIYRGKRLVNWSCDLKSAISDIEVENIQLEGPTKINVPGYTRPQKFGEMTYFKYPVDDSDEYVTVATTRLETMLGDTAVAVHPNDTRYAHLQGKYLRHPFDKRSIPLICDDHVEKEFGTGAVKITPAHDHNDFEMGLRHNLPFLNVINDSGCMEDVAEEFIGMKRFDARRKVEQELKNLGLFVEKRPHAMTLPICSRSKDVIEPIIKAQWYVDCTEMSKLATKCVENGELKFTPDYYSKVWYEFLSKGRSWCISRQIWWGHRIPAYKVIQSNAEQLAEEIWVSGRNLEEAYRKAEEQLGVSRDTFTLEQDEDVLDTWFSSALFPFSALGWPEETEDLARFYPSSLLETGNDIIFFWVARMVMMGYKLTGQFPFKEVLLHGTLRDASGRKMSKSLGNVIDPMAVIQGISLEALQRQLDNSNLDPKEIEKAKKYQKKDFPNGIPECGADALRFTLCSYNFKDTEINMNVVHVQSNKHFCNKIWQAYRFVTDKFPSNFTPTADFMNLSPTSPIDQWILSRLSHMVKQCDLSFKSYDLHHTTQCLYNFWFSDFCDIYIEYCKKTLTSNNETEVQLTYDILHLCVDTYLRVLSPFMPFLSEELWQRLVPRGENPPRSICIAEYPAPEQFPWQQPQLDEEMTLVQQTCTGILSIVQGYNLPRKTVEVFIKVDSEMEKRLCRYHDVFSILTKLPHVTIVTSDDVIPPASYPKIINPDIKAFIKIEGAIDFETEIGKLEKKIKSAEGKKAQLQRKSDSQNMNNNASIEQIHQIETQLEQLRESINVLRELKDR